MKNSNLLVTIGIPTFNDGDVIIEVLDSVKANNLHKLNFDVEIVVVDNASTDSTKKKVKDYIKTNHNLNISYYRNPKNIGAVRNLFEVAKRAKGEYLWFLCDDLLLPDSLKSFDKLIFKHAPDIIQLGVCEFSDKKENVLWCNDKKPIQLMNNFRRQDIGFSGFVGNLILKTEVWRKYSGNKKLFSNSYPHTWLAMRIFRDSKTLFAYEKPYILARKTRDYKSSPLRALHEIVLSYLKCLNENKKFLGGSIFDSILEENRFKELEKIHLKFLWNHIVKEQKHQLKTIPTREKLKIFWVLVRAAKFTRKQIKFLARIGFYLFRVGKSNLSAKDSEYLKFGDKANAANSKIIKKA